MSRDKGQTAALQAFKSALVSHRARLNAILHETPGRTTETWPIVLEIMAEVDHSLRLSRKLNQIV